MSELVSKRLSRELHRLSGWDKKTLEHDWYYPNKVDRFEAYPRYTCSFLLRQLQDAGLTIVLRFNRDMGGRAAMKSWDNMWCIGTFDMQQGHYPVAATPDDAVAKLAIELFKQGVLTRDGDE